MPAKASELEKVARKLGFEKVRQKGSHARWQHPDGRATTIPIQPLRFPKVGLGKGAIAS